MEIYDISVNNKSLCEAFVCTLLGRLGAAPCGQVQGLAGAGAGAGLLPPDPTAFSLGMPGALQILV